MAINDPLKPKPDFSTANTAIAPPPNGALPPPTPVVQEPIVPTRDDINKQLDRESAERQASLKSVSPLQTAAADMKAATTQSFDPGTPAPAPAFEAFKTALQAQDPALQQLQRTTAQQITQGLEQPDVGAVQQREALARSLQEARAQQEAEAVRAFGATTGQAGEEMREFDQRAILAQQQLTGDIAAQTQAARNQALQNALQFLSQESQQNLATAQLAVAESQFERNQVLERELQSNQLDYNARENAAGRAFQSAEASLDRELTRFTAEQQIEATAALQASQQAFESIMQDKGFLNTKELTEIDQAFQEEMQARGFDQATATLLTQLNHDKIMAEADRQFNANQAELQRSWASGERIDTQDFELQLNAQKENFTAKENDLNRTLQLDIQENQIAWEQARLTAEQTYDAARFQKGLDHETALAESQQKFQAIMQDAGFTQEQILQGQRLTQELAIADRQLTQSQAQFTAQLAQDDKQFAAQLGLEEDKLAQNMSLAREELAISWQQLGLQEKELNSMLESQDAADAMGMLSIAMEMGLSEDAMQPFVNRVFNVMGKDLDIPEEDLNKALGIVEDKTITYDTTTGDGILEKLNVALGGLDKREASRELTPAEKVIMEAKRQKRIETAQQEIQALNPQEIKSIVGNPETLQAYQEAGIIRSDTPVLTPQNVLQKEDFDKQGFEKGDLIVITGDDGFPMLVVFDSWNSRTNDPTFGKLTRESWLTGTKLSKGETTPSAFYTTGWKEP